jgi:hypothetical protein
MEAWSLDRSRGKSGDAREKEREPPEDVEKRRSFTLMGPGEGNGSSSRTYDLRERSIDGFTLGNEVNDGDLLVVDGLSGCMGTICVEFGEVGPTRALLVHDGDTECFNTRGLLKNFVQERGFAYGIVYGFGVLLQAERAEHRRRIARWIRESGLFKSMQASTHESKIVGCHPTLAMTKPYIERGNELACLHQRDIPPTLETRDGKSHAKWVWTKPEEQSNELKAGKNKIVKLLKSVAPGKMSSHCEVQGCTREEANNSMKVCAVCGCRVCRVCLRTGCDKGGREAHNYCWKCRPTFWTD